MRYLKTAALLLPLALIGGGCFSSPQTAQTAPSPATQTATTTQPAPAKTTTTTKAAPVVRPVAKPPASPVVIVSILDTNFSPSFTGITEGDTITWVNKGLKNHTSASNGAILWDSGNIPPGHSYSHTFLYQGSYSYRDSVSNFTGTIIVNPKQR